HFIFAFRFALLTRRQPACNSPHGLQSKNRQSDKDSGFIEVFYQLPAVASNARLHEFRCLRSTGGMSLNYLSVKFWTASARRLFYFSPFTLLPKCPILRVMTVTQTENIAEGFTK